MVPFRVSSIYDLTKADGSPQRRGTNAVLFVTAGTLRVTPLNQDGTAGTAANLAGQIGQMVETGPIYSVEATGSTATVCGVIGR